jgi:hypothetical protein
MRRLRRPALLVGFVSLMLAPVIAPPASGRSTADDLAIDAYLMPQGSGTRTRGLTFQIGIEIASSAGVERQITARVSLPAGLRWGNDGPDPSEGCTASEPAVCTTTLQRNPVGTFGAGWVWDVVAERAGPYVVTSTVESSEPDPNPSNNTSTFRFEAVQAGGGSGSSGGGGGGGTAVTAAAVKLTPQSLKAGTVVVASVRVRAGGSPVRPTGLRCTGTIGGAKLAGTPGSAAGTASCRYRTARGAKGKMLRGTIAFSARGKKFTRRFAAKLR